MDYRPIPDDHRDAFHRVTRYAFEPETGPGFEDAFSGERPDIFERRGLYDAPDAAADVGPDALRAVCGYYRFTARVRGERHPLGGVAAVASPPETRREGHVARLLDSVHGELRDRGFYLAALWPFEHPFYRRFGYAAAGPEPTATLPPGELTPVVGDPRGTFERLHPDDYERLDRVHREWATEGFALRRTEGWWRHRLFAAWGGDRYVYGWTDGDGDLRGYLAYRIEDDESEEGKTMAVDELAAADGSARRQLLRFCRNHDSQVERVRFAGPEWPGLLGRLSDPHAADVTLRPGPMVRVVDLSRAVAALSAREGVEGRVTVAVEDDRYPWNDGTFAVEIGDGSATCAPADAPADLRTDVGSLSLALTGARGVEQLRDDGRLTVRSESASRTLAAAYPPEPTWLREYF